MTRMAIFEQYEEKDVEVASRYKRDDYIKLRLLTGTFQALGYYLLMYAAVVLLICATFINRVDAVSVLAVAVCGILWLSVRMYFRIRNIRQTAGSYYDSCEKKLEEFSERMRVLNMLYDDEQARTTSWSGDF